MDPMMFDEFTAAVDRVVAMGYDRETAAYYVSRIGDTPELDAAGKVVVRDHDGNVVAVLKDYYH